MPKVGDHLAGSDYEWFVEPANPITNNAIVDELPGVEMETVRVDDGSERRVFRCSFDLVAKLKRAASVSASVDFRVFNKRLGSKIRRVSIFEPTKRKSEKKKM